MYAIPSTSSQSQQPLQFQPPINSPSFTGNISYIEIYKQCNYIHICFQLSW
jgi:hypothetical protein